MPESAMLDQTSAFAEALARLLEEEMRLARIMVDRQFSEVPRA